MDKEIETEQEVPAILDRATLVLIAVVLVLCFLFPSAALPQDDKDKQRPASYEHATSYTCIVKQEAKPGTMPAFHVYLVLEFKDGHSWSTQDAIVPIDYQLANNVRERWQRRTKARDKAFKYCDEWDLEVAVEMDKVNKQNAQKENAAAVQRASIK